MRAHEQATVNLEQIRSWGEQYKTAQMRHRLFVIRAPSQCGKSTLGKSLHDVMGWKEPFVQTVQDAPCADLKGFGGYISFYSVNQDQFVIPRALFQSNGDIHQLAQSQTDICSYSI